jgi:hypothetical protein
MKYFFDTEFIEDGKTIDLLSIGIVADDGRELYRRNAEARFEKADQWAQENIFPSLGVRLTPQGWGLRLDDDWYSRSRIKNNILDFIGQDSKPEFWAYYADYDWVALCQLFGRMIDLPESWPKYCRDVKQLCDSLGNPKLPKQEKEHHALEDARWTKQAYEFLMRPPERTGPWIFSRGM